MLRSPARAPGTEAREAESTTTTSTGIGEGSEPLEAPLEIEWSVVRADDDAQRRVRDHSKTSRKSEACMAAEAFHVSPAALMDAACSSSARELESESAASPDRIAAGVPSQ